MECSQASRGVEGGMTTKAQIRAERVRWKVEIREEMLLWLT